MTARLTFEIELELDGTIVPYRAATRDDPAEGGYAEDVEITDIATTEAKWAGDTYKWTTRSILDGIDRNAPEIQKLFANLLALKGEEASEAVYEEACG